MAKNNIPDTIYVYTDYELTIDCIVIDVSELAKAAGFGRPIAVSIAAWAQFVATPKECPLLHSNSYLLDAFWVLLQAVIRFREENQLASNLCVQYAPRMRYTHMLEAHCSSHNNIWLHISAVLPDED